MKPTHWTMPAETVNAYHYDVLSRWLLILMWGKEKFVPIVKGSSLDKYKNTMRERPGQSFSVQTLTHPASDN